MIETAFTKYHPVVNFIFFITAIVMTVVIFHPAALAVSLAASVASAVKFSGKKAVKYFFAFPFFVMILSMILNPLFVHKGLTVLFYIGESPVTVEAFAYGACTAMMVGAVIMWSYCYTQIMTSDRFMAVFGKIAPSTSLVFSMILRFLPRARRQAGKIASAQELLFVPPEEVAAEIEAGAANAADEADGQTSREQTKKTKIKKGIRVMSVLTTWALENSIDTADSMRARGYGLAGRTMYRKYRARPADIICGSLILALLAASVWAKASGVWDFYCYPEIEFGGRPVLPACILLAAMYAVPLVIEVWEDIKWTRSLSKI